MPELQTAETSGDMLAILGSEDLYKARLQELIKREAAIAEKQKNVNDLAKAAQELSRAAADDRSVAQARRDEAAKLNAEKAGALAQREQEISTAYSFQLQRDADMKRREIALKAKADLVQQKEDGFDSRQQKLDAREKEIDAKSEELKRRIDIYNQRLAAAVELAKTDEA